MRLSGLQSILRTSPHMTFTNEEVSELAAVSISLQWICDLIDGVLSFKSTDLHLCLFIVSGSFWKYPSILRPSMRAPELMWVPVEVLSCSRFTNDKREAHRVNKYSIGNGAVPGMVPGACLAKASKGRA